MEIRVDNTAIALIILFTGTVSAIAGYWLGLDTRRFKASKKGGVYKHKDSPDTSKTDLVVLDNEAIYYRGYKEGYDDGYEIACRNVRDGEETCAEY